ncbi:SPOSA6832_02587, partial [Sporobolomyces salmonicolor]
MHFGSRILSALLVLPAALALPGYDGKWREGSRSRNNYEAKLDYTLKKYAGLHLLSTPTSIQFPSLPPNRLKEGDLVGPLSPQNFTLIPETFRPKVYLEAEFLKSNVTVHFGNEVAIEDAQAPPVVEFTAKPVLYTLLVLDPDAPSRSTPYWSPFLHYALPGLKPKHGKVEMTSDALVEWTPPAPPAGSGPHRYVYLLYLQPTLSVSLPASRPSVNTTEDRMSFPHEDFIKENKLKLVGANYMISEAN